MEPVKGFRFKHFTIHDDQCQMKVGTDGVLLGAWVGIEGADKVLDIGAGSGLIALMVAQRTSSGTSIDAVEPAAPDVAQAKENTANTPWHDRVNIHVCTIQDFYPPRKYDLIISNPPFFSASLLPPSERRAQARHTVGLTHTELLESVSRLLTSEGRFAVILPAAEGDLFRKAARLFNLAVVRSLAFYTRPGKPQERWLFEMSAMKRELREESLTLYDGQGPQWSTAYQILTRDFYI